jgi:hypothetical protein
MWCASSNETVNFSLRLSFVLNVLTLRSVNIKNYITSRKIVQNSVYLLKKCEPRTAAFLCDSISQLLRIGTTVYIICPLFLQARF